MSIERSVISDNKILFSKILETKVNGKKSVYAHYPVLFVIETVRSYIISIVTKPFSNTAAFISHRTLTRQVGFYVLG